MADNKYTYDTVETDGSKDTHLTQTGKRTGTIVAVVVAVAALAGIVVWQFNDGEAEVNAVENSSIVDSMKDGAAEVPQALKDGTTAGDQATTRPNADGSTSKLDQK